MKREGYRLDETTVNANVPKDTPGVYYLGETIGSKFYVMYVGRSDTNVRSRLLQHAKTGMYSAFRFRVCKTIKSACVNECLAYHDYRDLSNKIHPTVKGNVHSCMVCNIDGILPIMEASK